MFQSKKSTLCLAVFAAFVCSVLGLLFPLYILSENLTKFLPTATLAKELCDEDPKFKVYAHDHLKKLEADFHTTRSKGEEYIAMLKSKGDSRLEDFEKEFNNFVKNYAALMQLLDQKPSFCERVIDELEHAIKYFNDHFLPKATATTVKH